MNFILHLQGEKMKESQNNLFKTYLKNVRQTFPREDEFYSPFTKYYRKRMLGKSYSYYQSPLLIFFHGNLSEGRNSSSKVSIQYRTLSLHLATRAWRGCNTSLPLLPFKRSRTWNVRSLVESEPRVKKLDKRIFPSLFLSLSSLLSNFASAISLEGLKNLGSVWFFRNLGRWMIDSRSFACHGVLFPFFPQSIRRDDIFLIDYPGEGG